MTRFITLGTVYEFVLTWTESMVKFCHNFKVWVHPKGRINVNAHSYFLQNLNITNPNADNSRYLFPEVGGSYFKYLASSGHAGQFTYTSDFPEIDTKEESLKPFEAVTGASSSESKGEAIDQTALPEKTGTYRRVKVMTYNIWNMNSKSARVGGYTERMGRLKEVGKRNPFV